MKFKKINSDFHGITPAIERVISPIKCQLKMEHAGPPEKIADLSQPEMRPERHHARAPERRLDNPSDILYVLATFFHITTHGLKTRTLSVTYTFSPERSASNWGAKRFRRGQ
jgi:hypothetical protein